MIERYVFPDGLLEYEVAPNDWMTIDVIQLAWLIDQWQNETESDKELAPLLAEHLNNCPREHVGPPVQITASRATAFLVGFPQMVEHVKKKLEKGHDLSQPTESTSSPTVPENSFISGSSAIWSTPMANSSIESDRPPAPQND